MFLKLYLIALPVLFAIDMLWIVGVARTFYVGQIGTLLKPDINWAAAIVFYLLYIAGLIVFVVMPALDAQSLSKALLMGAFFGFVAYATYDLTNLSTLKDWTYTVTFVDLAWGTVLSSAVSSLTYFIATKFFA